MTPFFDALIPNELDVVPALVNEFRIDREPVAASRCKERNALLSAPTSRSHQHDTRLPERSGILRDQHEHVRHDGSCGIGLTATNSLSGKKICNSNPARLKFITCPFLMMKSVV